ncbi:MAG: hypothetical protein GF398_04485 [Chitinivibrionales bacterium]|nr:hypothetical protein [Chitinivibrionales bacterium]
MNEIQKKIRQKLDELPIVDVHTHLGGEGLRQARNLADIVSYHWLHLELQRAGSPAEVGEGRYPSDPDRYMEQAAPYFEKIRNTSNHYVFSGLIRDLYGFKDSYVTPDNWRELDIKVREHAGDANRISAVLDKANIRKMTVPFKDGMPDNSDRYIPYEYGEYLFAAVTHRQMSKLTGSTDENDFPRSAAALRKSVDQRMAWLHSEKQVKVLHIWIRDSWSYRRCHERDADYLLDRVLRNRNLTTEQEDLAISFCADALAQAAAHYGMTLQLFHGMEIYREDAPVSVAGFWNERFMRSMSVFAAEHPEVTMDIFLATRIPSHEAASIARSAANISLSGGWWHAFTPSTLVTFFKDRLELLPHTGWNAFFSDGYIVEWVYGKLLMTKHCLSRALADYVDDQFISFDDAVDIARRLLHDNAYSLYKLS